MVITNLILLGVNIYLFIHLAHLVTKERRSTEILEDVLGKLDIPEREKLREFINGEDK